VAPQYSSLLVVMSSPSSVHRADAAVRSLSPVYEMALDQGKQFAVVRSYSSGLLAKVRIAGSNPVVRSKNFQGAVQPTLLNNNFRPGPRRSKRDRRYATETRLAGD
jgi:hypothetical protein